MKRINSLSDLLIEELVTLLNAENQFTEALPKITEASQSSSLRLALEDFMGVANGHIHRLQDILSNIGQSTQGGTCNAMKVLIKEAEDVIQKTGKGQDRDAAIIDVIQQMEEYEITKYKTVREHAADLGHTRIVELLTETLNEERAMIFHLKELAQYMINAQAVNPFDSPLEKKEGGFYIPKGKFSRGGIKKRPKNAEVSRFISEGNPNVQGQQGKEEGKEGKDVQNTEGQ